MTLPPLEAWFKALHSPVGYCLVTNDRERAIRALYKARAEYHKTNPGELEGLSVHPSPTAQNEVWIVHKEVRKNAKGAQ